MAKALTVERADTGQAVIPVAVDWDTLETPPQESNLPQTAYGYTRPSEGTPYLGSFGQNACYGASVKHCYVEFLEPSETPGVWHSRTVTESAPHIANWRGKGNPLFLTAQTDPELFARIEAAFTAHEAQAK